jgi:hypothetical protein
MCLNACESLTYIANAAMASFVMRLNISTIGVSQSTRTEHIFPEALRNFPIHSIMLISFLSAHG